jgi:hypothetical protein
LLSDLRFPLDADRGGILRLCSRKLLVSSRLVELRRVSGTWHHEIRRSDETLVAADRARGAFLDLVGRIRPAPVELLDDLLRGELPA